MAFIRPSYDKLTLGDNVNYGSFIVEHLNKNLGIFSTASADGIRNASNQLKALQLFSSFGLPTPRTAFAQNPSHIGHLIEKIGGYPIVVKLLHGSGGTGVALLKDRSSAIPIIQSLYKSRSKFILQEYLDSGGKDYRVIVIGNQVVASVQRDAKRGDFRANLQLGGSGRPVTLSGADKDLCIKAARAADLSVAGVDIIKSSGKTYLLEINACFGFKAENITGINIARKIIQYCEQNYQEKDQEKIMSNQLLEANKQLGLFTGDKYIQEVFKKAKGKRISYKDRHQKSHQVTVKRLEDIYQIMIDSFIVN